MKRVFKILAAVTSVICASVMLFAFSACQQDESAPVHKEFGQFSQYGYMLTSFATREIGLDEAVGKLTSSSRQAMTVAYLPEPLPTDESTITAMLKRSNHIVVTAKFFKEGSEEMQVEVSDQTGLVVNDYLKKNTINAATGLSIKNLYLTDAGLRFMDEENKKFKESDDYINVPFANLYTYHTDEQANHLIVQMHDFVDIPASALSGGVNCYYRQDTEILYDILPLDNNNLSGPRYARISKWQTSLGSVVSTAADSIHEGYVFQVEVEWLEKGDVA